MTERERENIYKTGVDQLRAQAEYVGRLDTQIVRDMKTTARDLGIVDLLLKHQRICYAEAGTGYDLVEQALISLGVSSAELLANQQKEA